MEKKVWDINKAAKSKMASNPKRIWVELRDINGRLHAKGDINYVRARLSDLNGVLGTTHFFMPASWSVETILAAITGKI